MVKSISLEQLIADISASDLQSKDRLIASCKANSHIKLASYLLCNLCDDATIEQAIWLRNRDYFDSLWANKYGVTSLMIAARDADAQAVSTMLLAGFDIHATDANSNNALNHAVQKLSYDRFADEGNKCALICMTMLLEAGITVDSLNHEHMTPLMQSIRYGTDELKRSLLLLTYGANPKVNKGLGLLDLAKICILKMAAPISLQQLITDISASDLDCKEILIKSCHEYTYAFPSTAFLSGICKNATVEQAMWLKARQYFPALWVRPDGETALMHAVAIGSIRSASVMVHAGYDVNAVNLFGNNALMYAMHNYWSANCRLACCMILLKAGCAVNARNDFGQTALILAYWNAVSDPETVKILLKYGADQTVADFAGRTPLMIATHLIDAIARERTIS